jgi:predicted O-linked N-acetylglucosamine transferase (SPINDLY family)
MGLPVLTMTGKSFASRMAGALLTAAKLPELITYNLADYENMAVTIAHDKIGYDNLKQRLNEVKANGVLFDTPRFVTNLEEHFKNLLAEL